jgi:hypothetical protein
MDVALMQMEIATWLLLLYALPAKRGGARVTLWRKLKKFGALPLKTSAYVLPDNAMQYERLQWLAKEIQDAGGEATLIRVEKIEGMPYTRIIRLFNAARADDYRELEEAGKALARKGTAANLRAEFERLQRRFAEIQEVDYFRSPAATGAKAVLGRLEKMLRPRALPVATRLQKKDFAGKKWVTRPRPGIDRAGSAWLIRRFIDAKARFAFADEMAGAANALPFDMANVEFSHHGDDCTFETLVRRFGITDKAVLRIAEMVHDADLEDGKFQRVECLGINSVLRGWARTAISDAQLLAKGMECFEGLYRGLHR